MEQEVKIYPMYYQYDRTLAVTIYSGKESMVVTSCLGASLEKKSMHNIWCGRMNWEKMNNF